ncbi:unnamed protein product [Orchesella dallaii]|uniref:Uncharacterized protein n=1 Tax=Orchesella dallaii TaxID=48710 RepID=A0ABP1RIN1_9HEXA
MILKWKTGPFQSKLEEALKFQNPELFNVTKNLVIKPKNASEFAKFMRPDYFLEVIGKCEMDAYIDEFVQSKALYLDLKHKQGNKKLVLSKKSFGQLYHNWYFRSVPWPSIMFEKRIRTMFESGLVNAWMDWSLRIETWNGTKELASNVKENSKDQK